MLEDACPFEPGGFFISVLLEEFWRIPGLDSFHQQASMPIPTRPLFRTHAVGARHLRVAESANNPWLPVAAVMRCEPKLGAFNNPGNCEILVFSWFLATRWRKDSQSKDNFSFQGLCVFANNFYLVLATSWCQPVLWTCCAIVMWCHVPSEEAVFSKWSNNVLMVWIGVEEIIFTAEVAKNKTKNTKDICHNSTSHIPD